MDRELSLIDHLAELRKRLIYCLAPFLIAVIFSAFLARLILEFLKRPARGIIEKLAFFSPQEVAVVYVKIAIFTALVFCLPVILYQIWKFILPALEESQKRFTLSFVFWTFFTFLMGSSFGYFILLPVSLKFLLALASDELVPVISISKYVSFALGLVLGCGVAFELPVLAWILTRLGIANARFLRRKRKYAVVAIFILAAIITPTTDPFTMCILAIPMIILYEISIWVSQWNQR